MKVIIHVNLMMIKNQKIFNSKIEQNIKMEEYIQYENLKDDINKIVKETYLELKEKINKSLDEQYGYLNINAKTYVPKKKKLNNNNNNNGNINHGNYGQNYVNNNILPQNMMPPSY